MKRCLIVLNKVLFFASFLIHQAHISKGLISLQLMEEKCLTGSEESNIKALEIKSTTITADQNIGFYKVDETLNLTCIFRNESILPDVVLEWVVPSKTSNSQNRAVYKQGINFVVLVIENLQENDSGEYKCRAVHNGTPFFSSENSVRIKVKNKKKECTDVMFQCSPGICIQKRYTCDGFKDCPYGEDESPAYCGPGNPCENKLMCPENRCIPITWCCESHREPNCTTKIKHSCCTHVEKLTRDVDGDVGYQYEQQRFSDMGFLQTTVYTVIGCAMAFMFIVTIIVIAICRVHVRRSLLSRCPTAGGRNLPLGGRRNVHGNSLAEWSLYDLDLYFNRTGTDIVPMNPLLVTYNINNGVQFVGRPVDPPPYCEIVTSPPKEGPPPPYASRENLCSRRDKTEEPKPETEPEATESDALLGSIQDIAVISSNAMDGEEAADGGETRKNLSGSSSHVVDDSKIADEPQGNYKPSGESSSLVSDISGAVNKMAGAMLDGSLRRQSKTVSVNQGKKF